MSACGGGDEEAADNGGGNDDNVITAESLIDWMKGGTFSFDYKIIVETGGQETEGTGAMAIDQGRFAMRSVMDAGGVEMNMRMVMKDDVMYMVDDNAKTYMAMPTTTPDAAGGMNADFTVMEKTGSGEGEVDGKTLPYEEYAVEGSPIKFFMDGDTVYAIVNETGGSTATMIITNASKTVPAELFDIPDDYQDLSI